MRLRGAHDPRREGCGRCAIISTPIAITAAASEPPLPFHHAPSRGCIAQAPSRRDCGWRRICSRADAPWRRRALYSASSAPTRRPRLVEQYARHGCEAWAREGRSSSGSGACAVRPRGEAAPHVLAETYASRPRRPGVRSLGATRPAQSGQGGRLGALGIGIAHSVCVLPQRRRAVLSRVRSGDALIRRRARASGRRPTRPGSTG